MSVGPLCLVVSFIFNQAACLLHPTKPYRGINSMSTLSYLDTTEKFHCSGRHIFIRKRRAQYKISIYYIIVLRETGAPQQQQGRQLEAHRDAWI